MKKRGADFTETKDDAAFYGPKIDIMIKDSLKREWQCATIQIDMQIPSRFGANYINAESKEEVPIVIHRAIMGSMERFIGVLLEHLNGNLPLWLSPIQVKIVNFTDRNLKACEKLMKELKESLPMLRIDSDFRSTTVSDKIRDSELQKIPYTVVIGDKEEESKTIAIRERGNPKPKFKVKLKDFISEIKEKIEKRM